MKKYIEDALKEQGITELNPMQSEMQSLYPCKGDIMLISSTGSGKTIAYLIPLVENTKFESGVVRSVIIVPSRELALQIDGVLRSLKSGLRVCCCYGGHDARVERRSLAEAPDVVIGTPGRLLDHISSGVLDVSKAESIVLDEFDKSLEYGFTEEMREIFSEMKSVNKRVLVSATYLDDIPDYVNVYDLRVVDYVLKGEDTPQIEHNLVETSRDDKQQVLFNLLCENGDGKSIVFCNFREATEELSDYLWGREIENEFFHGAMEQVDRERVMTKFKNSSCNVLVATDLAARGLDISSIKSVIHYQMPQSYDAFIHRNGRTARMNQTGKSFIIKSSEEPLKDYLPSNLTLHKPKFSTSYNHTPQWTTVYIGKGKKDKLSKVDIVGFFCQKGGISKDDIGVIDLKDFAAYVAIREDKVSDVLHKIKDEKIKGKKTKIAIAK